jgi:hypothetical protein
VTTGGCESTSVVQQRTFAALHISEVCKQCTSAIMRTAANNADLDMVTSWQEQEERELKLGQTVEMVVVGEGTDVQYDDQMLNQHVTYAIARWILIGS